MNTLTISRNFRSLVATTVLSASACGLATVCIAAETDPSQETVKYSDLAISNPEGAATLYARIQEAARHVCLTPDNASLSSKTRMGACTRVAIADAVAKIDRPALSAVYYAHNGQPAPIVLAAGPSR